jgi:hypothetical protein
MSSTFYNFHSIKMNHWLLSFLYFLFYFHFFYRITFYINSCVWTLLINGMTKFIVLQNPQTGGEWRVIMKLLPFFHLALHAILVKEFNNCLLFINDKLNWPQRPLWLSVQPVTAQTGGKTSVSLCLLFLPVVTATRWEGRKNKCGCSYWVWMHNGCVEVS